LRWGFRRRGTGPGIQAAGYGSAPWGPTPRVGGGKPVPVLPADAPPERAKELGRRCRDLGLEPLMMFAGVYPDAPNHLDALKSRVRQAAAAAVPQVLTFGSTQKGRADARRLGGQVKVSGPQ